MNANFLIILAFFLMAFPLRSEEESKQKSQIKAEFSNWLFVQSDKALQVRYREDSRENGIGSFTVQLRINFDDGIYCSAAICKGYYLTFAYPTLDNASYEQSFFKFYNSYEGIYTLDDPMILKMEFPDGSKRYLENDGFYYTLSNSNELQFAGMLFSNCVDDILSNSDYSRCNSGRRRGEFQEEFAYIIQ